jgi:hypothetical protein
VTAAVAAYLVNVFLVLEVNVLFNPNYRSFGTFDVTAEMTSLNLV